MLKKIINFYLFEDGRPCFQLYLWFFRNIFQVLKLIFPSFFVLLAFLMFNFLVPLLNQIAHYFILVLKEFQYLYFYFLKSLSLFFLQLSFGLLQISCLDFIVKLFLLCWGWGSWSLAALANVDIRRIKEGTSWTAPVDGWGSWHISLLFFW